MKCPECDELLRQRLDGQAGFNRQGLELHLAWCAPCREWHQAAQLLEDGLCALPRPTAPADLTERIILRVTADRCQRLRWQRRAVVAAAAACLLLTPLAVSLLGLLAGHSPAPAPAVTARPPVTPATPGPSVQDSVAEAGSAVASLTDRLAEQTRDQARRLWSVSAPMDVPEVLPGFRALQAPLDPAAQSLREAGQGVSAGIDTVASSARRAVSYFVRELPPLQPGRGTFD
jgi:hypothetical protein